MDHGGQRGLARAALVAIISFAAASVVDVRNDVRDDFRADAPAAAVVMSASMPANGGPTDDAHAAGLDPGGEIVISSTVPEARDAAAQRARDAGAVETARLEALGTVVVRPTSTSVAPAVVAAAGSVPHVKVQRALTYRLHSTGADLSVLTESVGARALHVEGVDGTGIRIAIIDSGIDYTHASLGGAGTPGDYATCTAQRASTPSGVCASLIGPNAPKVISGFDFVGDAWPNGPVAPDANPIDVLGHGTHVADIAAGRNGPGGAGVAPGAKLLALKACSSITSACNGTALLQAVDRAIDPNGDGSTADRVDVLNLSLGTAYGSSIDPLATAVERAVAVGVIVVASAGNSGDQPFIVASPSSSPSAISVGQTTLPTEARYPLTASAPEVGTITDALYQVWSPRPYALDAVVAPAIATGAGCAPSDYALAASVVIALARRGTCDITVKAAAAATAGASALVVANNAPGAAPAYGATAAATIPVLSIGQSDGDRLFAAARGASIRVVIDPRKQVSLGGTMVSSSARGPSVEGLNKPDVTAPGAWLSAASGTGAGISVFSGTSGSAPVVAGSAALLRAMFPTADVAELKALLSQHASGADVLDAAAQRSGAPIAWSGAGDIHVDRAAWATMNAIFSDQQSTWSLGSLHPAAPVTLAHDAWFNNRDGRPHSYVVAARFRDPADASTGAITFTMPTAFTLPAFSGRSLTFKATLDPTKLPPWRLGARAGATGNNGAILQEPELDGVLVVTRDDGETFRIPWYTLAHRAVDIQVPESVAIRADERGSFTVTNSSATSATMEAYTLTGLSPVIDPASTARGKPGSGRALVDLAAAGASDDGTVISFAVATHRRYSSPNAPGAIEVIVDADANGVDDFVVYNAEPGADPYSGAGFGSDGRNIVYVKPLGGAASATGFDTLADYDGSVTVLRVRLSTLGARPGQRLLFRVGAIDAQYTGESTDTIGTMSYVPGRPAYTVVEGSSLPIGAGATATYTVVRSSGDLFDGRTGILIVARDGSTRDHFAVVARSGVG